MPIGAEEVRAAVDGVVLSNTFARASRARALLVYLVETEQSGGASTLKGFTIGQDVFGKDDSFDPSTDAVVRVQAGRLREQLANYYRTEGARQPIEIVVPKGSYVPRYMRRAIEPPVRDANAVASTSPAPDAPFKTGSIDLDDRNSELAPLLVVHVQRSWIAPGAILLLLSMLLFLIWS